MSGLGFGMTEDHGGPGAPSNRRGLIFAVILFLVVAVIAAVALASPIKQLFGSSNGGSGWFGLGVRDGDGADAQNTRQQCQ